LTPPKICNFKPSSVAPSLSDVTAGSYQPGYHQEADNCMNNLSERIKSGIELMTSELELHEAATCDAPPPYYMAIIGLLRDCDRALSNQHEGYSPARIAWELEQTAMGKAHFGNALRVAKDFPDMAREDRSLLDRYATGTQGNTDHVALSDLSIRILNAPPSTAQGLEPAFEITGDENDKAIGFNAIGKALLDYPAGTKFYAVPPFEDGMAQVPIKPSFTKEMKAELMSEFSVKFPEACIGCVGDTCQVCDGQGQYMRSINVPWTVMKDIFNRMYASMLKANKAKQW